MPQSPAPDPATHVVLSPHLFGRRKKTERSSSRLDHDTVRHQIGYVRALVGPTHWLTRTHSHELGFDTSTPCSEDFRSISCFLSG